MANPEPWVLFVCGDIPESDTIEIDIEDSKACTVNELKRKIHKETDIPVNEQSLYFGENELGNDEEKLQDKGLESGAAVCVKRPNIEITAKRTDYNGEVKLFIPGGQIELWTVKKVRECICHKFGFPVEVKHYLTIGATVLKDEDHEKKPKKITEYLQADYTLKFTPFKEVSMATPEKSKGKSMYVPVALSAKDMTEIYKHQPVSQTGTQIDAWKSTWSFKVTAQPPTEFEVPVPECELTPVFKLRQVIQEHVKIPAVKQKLSIGDKVLYDWDNEGRPKLIRNYPSIHDGATIKLTEIRQGKCIKVKEPSHSSRMIPSKSDLIFSVPLNEIVDPPSSIIIYPSDKMTLETLVKIVSNCEGTSSDILYVQKTGTFGSGISKVKSMADIKDGYCVTTKQT